MKLELINLTKKYKKTTAQVPALNNINLSVATGDKVLIKGASGAGKTTLLNILGLVDQHYQGQYLIDGVDIKTMNDKVKSILRNEKFGLIFQEYELLENETVYNNVIIPLLYSGRKQKEFKGLIDDILEKLSIIQYKKQKVRRLSGGERQRVAIARALVNKPTVIIADEATGSLDGYTKAMVLKLIEDLLTDEHIFIYVTHEFDYVDISEYRVIELEHGEIVK